MRRAVLVNLGKHRRHIDDNYLQWIANEFPESDWWWKTAARASTTRVKIFSVAQLLSELKDCSRKKDLPRGRKLHMDAVKAGIHSNIYIAVALINLYNKCGSMEYAITVFDSVQEPTVVCWNVVIQGYADNGQGSVALALFSRMKEEGKCAPDSFTYLAALKACTLLAADGGKSGKRECLEMGRQIHSEIGDHTNLFAQSTLINLYGRCGSMKDARTVYDSIQQPDVVCWNAIIRGYAENGQGCVALDLFSRMKDEGRCEPNYLTYLAALKACTLLAADGGEAEKRACLERGRQIHFEIGRHMNHFVENTLISFYGKCGSMEDARTVYDSIQEPSVVCWNAIILGYAENGQGSLSLDLFSRMKDEGRCAPDSITYLAALKACTLLAANGGEAEKRECLETGRRIHSEIGCHINESAQTTLINLYAKCGSMEDARTVFDSIRKPDVVSWTSIMLGYAENGQGLVSLDLFSRMKDEGKCAPDSFTYAAALKACTLLATDGGESGKTECLERGRQIHSEIGHQMDLFVQNTLINLYTNCGSMEDARRVFDSIKKPDVVSWNAIIVGSVENGQGLVALDLFSRMKNERRCAPDSVTYLAALKACCSIGALTIGRRIHSEISEYNPRVVSCLVDFYAKCGNMEEAREVFDLHPGARIVSTWNGLLAGYARFVDTASVFSLFDAMQENQGFQPDSITFVCLLSCCSHAGLVEKAWHYLELMPKRYQLAPDVMHYGCMIDLLGRANKLDEAVALLQKMPCDPDAVTWTALLSACRKWKNAEIGRWAFKALMDLDRKVTSAYSLMAKIYDSRDMLWEEQEGVLEAGACKLPGEAYVMDELGRMAKFVVGEVDGVNVDDKEQGYVGISRNEMQDRKENALCGHSERRAVFYGILNTPPGEVIRVVKNMRICNDCHFASKMISKIAGRAIMIRDETRFHVMDNGNCSCRDYF